MNRVTAMNPLVLESLNATIAECKERGFNVGLFSGLRLEEDQEKLYALGRTVANPDGKSESKPMGNIITNARAYESWHSFGLAGDLVFKNEKGNWNWNKKPEEWYEIAKVAEMFGLEWGGHWTKFPDYPHFQRRGKIPNVREAKKLLLEKGIEAVWALI